MEISILSRIMGNFTTLVLISAKMCGAMAVVTRRPLNHRMVMDSAAALAESL